MILRQSALAKIVISYHPLKGQIYSKRKAIKRQQRKRPLFSHLDRENSVDKGFFFFYDRDEEFCLEDPTR